MHLLLEREKYHILVCANALSFIVFIVYGNDNEILNGYFIILCLNSRLDATLK